ncbi:MAG: AsmA-like C-terminal domain-containing protein [Alphaproteobacteria bacterium]
MLTRRFIPKFIFGLILGVLIAVLAGFNAVLIWVATGPRELDQVTPYIEQALSAEDGSYTVDIGETVLLWDGWKHPIDIRLRKIKVLSRQGRVFSTFPDISLGVDILSLPKILPTRITINKPVISLRQHADMAISFGYEKNTDVVDIAEEEATGSALSYAALIQALLFENNSRMRELRFVHVKDANISIGAKGKGVFFQAEKADIEIRRDDEDGTVELKSAAKISYASYQSDINYSLIVKKNTPVVMGSLQFKQLMPHVIEPLFFTSTHTKPINSAMSGALNYKIDSEKNILEQLVFQLDIDKGTFEHDKLAAALPINFISLRGQASDNLQHINLTKLNADFGGIKILGEGVFGVGEQFSAKGNFSLADADAKDVNLLWPPSLSPVSREWVISNITQGHVPSASVQLDIKPGDFEQPILPRESINALIGLQKGTIRYLPDHPEVENVEAIIHIDALSLDGDLSAGHTMKNTKLSAGKVRIADLNADNPRIEVNFEATAPATDAVAVLRLPRLNHADNLNLKDNIEGSVTAKAELAFDFYAPKDEAGNSLEPEVDYHVAVNLNGVGQQQFMNKFDIIGASGALEVQNSGLTFKGKANVNGADVSEADVRYLFNPEEGFDTFINVKAIAPVTSFKRFGYPEFSFLKGSVGVEAEVSQGKTQELSKATFNLVNTTVEDNPIGWIKPDKEPATLKLTAEKKEGVLSIPSFELTGKDANIAGVLGLTPDLSSINMVKTEKATLGQTNISSLLYDSSSAVTKLEVDAKVLDLSGYMKKDSEGFSFKNFPAMQFKADIGKVIIAPNAEVMDLKGHLTCDAARCTSADIKGKTEGKDFVMKIMKNPKGKRQFSLHADDAGKFLRAVDVFDGMEGGTLSISGNYDDTRASPSLKAKVVMIDFIMKDAPILGKILSLASLTGFFDTMQGNGIAFKKLLAPFTLTDDVITLKDAKAYGPAIGITADGTITMPHAALAIDGTVVPSYTINNVLGKVPLLGDILTGGGEGVFAAKFTVKGTDKEPDVSVNPLSILTPGFLRNIFDAPDKVEEE